MIPSTAQAKVSFRLVADQTPQRVEQQLRDHLARLMIPGVSVSLRSLQGALPWSARSGTAAVEAARRALATAFEHDAVIGGTGGTIPIVPELARFSDAEILLIGFGLPGENAHAPNEWIDLDNIRRGRQAMLNLYEELARVRSE